MKAMFTAFAAIALIAVGAWYVLDSYAGFGSDDRQASASVRID